MVDKYFNSGQAGALGPNARVCGNTFQQARLDSNRIPDLKQLAKELARLRDHLKRQAKTEDQDLIVADIIQAKKAAEAGDGKKVLSFLKSAGRWALGAATDIGTNLAAEAIKKAMTPNGT